MTIITQSVFQCGETVPIRADVKDYLSALINPSNGLTVTLYDPEGTKEVDAATMTCESTGKYVYYYNTTALSVKGTWSYEVKAQDGSGAVAKYTVAKGSFKLT